MAVLLVLSELKRYPNTMQYGQIKRIRPRRKQRKKWIGNICTTVRKWANINRCREYGPKQKYFEVCYTEVELLRASITLYAFFAKSLSQYLNHLDIHN